MFLGMAVITITPRDIIVSIYFFIRTYLIEKSSVRCTGPLFSVARYLFRTGHHKSIRDRAFADNNYWKKSEMH